MSFVTIDFETFYDNECGFKKQTTEEYVNDSRFHVIGMGIKVDFGPTQWYAGEGNVSDRLREIDWDNTAVLCHNAHFDCAILAWMFGVTPAFIYDTLPMARAIHGVEAGGSLKALAERYGLGEKGTEVINAFGKHYLTFSPEELERYGEYCKNDVELTYALFHRIAETFPDTEYELIDSTIRMFIDPTLRVDIERLRTRLRDIKEEKGSLLSSLMQQLDCADEEEVRKKLSSNPKFAAVLKQFEVTAPMKTSPATGKPTYALAKNDEGFIALTEHEDPFIQQLCAVRLGTKSTLEESRIEKFIAMAGRNLGKMPIPLKYYGTHTGRWAGSDGVNMQNLPSRDKKKKTLKSALLAPLGNHLINCDSSQIEARVLAWWAGQEDVVEQFRNGDDVYSVFASKIYGRLITKADPIERFVGKTCVLGLGYGTGAEKLRHTLKTQPPGANLSTERCKGFVDTYRMLNCKIVDLWRECDRALSRMLEGVTEPFYLGNHQCVLVTNEGIRLPNGLYIRYPGLKMQDGQITYVSRRGELKIWGGAMTENIVQALARIVVGEQMVEIKKRGYKPILTVHDAVVIAASLKDEQLQAAMDTITSVMSTAPQWAYSLPVACEAKYGPSYGDC
jgi:DNA polymerase